MGNIREMQAEALVFLQITHELSPHDFGGGADSAEQAA